MSSYKKYPKYENVSFPFLDEIPSSWVLVPLYALSNFRQGKLHEPYIDEDGEFICVNSRFVSTEGKKFKHCNINLSPVEKSDILMVMSDLPNGRALAKALFVKGKNNYALNQRVCAITPTNIYPKFLYYQLNRNAYFLSFDDGSNQTNLSNYDFKKYPVLLPSKQEQQTIANYLDKATAKIDTLIEKQTKLIELLKEKRQAVISTAVTRGLDSTVAMKDSGVEWLGEIPEGWEIPKIGFIGEVTNGSTPDKTNKKYWTNGSIPWLASGCLNIDKVIEPTSLISTEAYNSCSVKLIPSRSLLLGMVGQGKTRGTSALLGIDACINQNLAAIIPSVKMNVIFLHFLFQTMYVSLRESGRGSNQAALNCDIINSIRIPLPSILEQENIVTFVNGKIEKIDSLISKSTKAIDLLKEKRTALISSAVTGKIDVRGEAA